MTKAVWSGVVTGVAAVLLCSTQAMAQQTDTQDRDGHGDRECQGEADGRSGGGVASPMPIPT